ncbi:aminotransferase [Pyrenophora seminiperda CCB06]|uniref:Aminotransferase n=1 Tax=Pyrenophora seminiperda CCB06 TaxID=1302712 RepID=A0A3M7M2H3_9PLEO|nr:aminotransferase [Pyrenophora seminiperda CCB06]
MAPALLVNESNSPSPTFGSNALAPNLDLSHVPNTPRNRQRHRSALIKRSVRDSPLLVKEAEGNWLLVSDGTKTWKIFDGSGGAAVSNIGHKDARVFAAINEQQATGISYAPSMSFDTEASLDFADLLLESTNDQMAQVAFYSSGSEAMEAAQKLAYQYHSTLNMDAQHGRHWFIARDRSYHGATLGALEVSGHKGRKEMYKQILPNNAKFISPCNPYRDMWEGESVKQYVERLAKELDDKICELGPNTVAGFIMEPVVGAALGCVPALPGYLSAMKRVCRNHGVLFILDEVMCGMGRTGYMHAWQEEGVVPDIQLVGKGLAGGYAPISALLAGIEVADTLGDEAFAHGHTFQNLPMACAAGLAVQQIVQDDCLIENVREKGDKLMKKLMARLESHPNVGNIRGKGFFYGIEFVQDKKSKTPFDRKLNIAWRIHELGLKDGYNIYIYPGSGTVDGDRGDHIIIAPAFNITNVDIDIIVESVGKLVVDFFADFSTSSKL